MSIEISITGIEDVQAKLDTAVALMENSADGLMQAVENTALPDVIEESQTVWGVDTGEYSSSWNLEPISSNSVSLFNTSDHARALEDGWTRGGTTITSPGVLYPSVQNNIDNIAQALQEWLDSQL